MAYILKDKYHAGDRKDVGASGVAEITIPVPRGKSALAVAREEAMTAPNGRVVIVYNNGRTRVYDQFA